MTPSIDKDDWTAPIVYLIYISLADILPITAQLVSIIIILDKSKLYRSSLGGSPFATITTRHFSLPLQENKLFDESNSNESGDVNEGGVIIPSNRRSRPSNINFRRNQANQDNSYSHSFTY